MRHSKGTEREARDAVLAFKLNETHGLEAFEIMGDIVNRAKRLHRIAERWCSEEMSDETSTRLTATEKGLEESIRNDALRLGLTVSFSGDPRGFVVKLHGPKGRHAWNTWGGESEGYGVGEPND